MCLPPNMCIPTTISMYILACQCVYQHVNVYTSMSMCIPPYLCVYQHVMSILPCHRFDPCSAFVEDLYCLFQYQEDYHSLELVFKELPNLCHGAFGQKEVQDDLSHLLIQFQNWCTAKTIFYPNGLFSSLSGPIRFLNTFY